MNARNAFERARRALSVAGILAAFGVAIGAASLAPERVREQDDAHVWRELAQAYLETGDTLDWSDAPAAVHLAGLPQIEADASAPVLTRGLDDLRSFETAYLDTARTAARERRCLAEAIYYEARSEGFAGQLAVAEVVMNRVRHRAYPDTVCGVVYQGAERNTGCQFTFACDGSMGSAPYGRGWRRSQLVAEHVLMGFARPVTRSATHYHTVAVDPFWNDSLVRTRRIGAHVFYRLPNRSERQLLVAEREA